MAALAKTLKSASSRLAQALGLEPREARLEAQILAARALGVNRAWLIAHDRDELSAPRTDALEALIARREQGEPVAYILGEREFFGLNLIVTPDVLIPRPDTELLVLRALERIPANQPSLVLDLGTGSGAVALAIAVNRPLAWLLAVDRSPAALDVARANARQLGLENVNFLLSDWFDRVSAKNFDIIVANPPYIAVDDPHLWCGDLRFEPGGALQSGAEGLADIHRIVAGAPSHLCARGWLLFEHGHEQGVPSRKLLHRVGWSRVMTWKDISGRPRVSGGQLL